MPLTNLNDIMIFMAVVDAGSFVAGGQALGLSRSAAGKAVIRLEDRLGARLLNRTTRTLSLTEEGRVFYEGGLQVIAVNWEEEGATFRRAVKILSSFQLKFVSDTSGKVGKSYGVNAIPTMLLIDKDGKVAFMTIGYGESVINSLVPAVNKALGLDDGSSASAGAP